MTNNNQKEKTGISRLKDLHEQYKERGFYKYAGKNILLISSVYVLLVFLFFLTSKYLVDFNAVFQAITNTLSDRFMIILFFVSESFTGLVPVDLFVIWTQKFEQPIYYLALLGILSYAGGIISYQIGLWISRWPKVKAFTERRLRNYIEFVRKWGGAFIIIAALFPLTPFSTVVIAITMFKYPFKLFLLYGLTRLFRFVLQGILFFEILNLDQWVV